MCEQLQGEPTLNSEPATDAAPTAGEPGEGGEPACWAHLVCPECGTMASEGHRQGCVSGRARPGTA